MQLTPRKKTQDVAPGDREGGQIRSMGGPERHLWPTTAGSTSPAATSRATTQVGDETVRLSIRVPSPRRVPQSAELRVRLMRSTLESPASRAFPIATEAAVAVAIVATTAVIALVVWAALGAP